MSNLNINPIPRPTVLVTPAHRIKQGGRVVYYFSLEMAQFDDLLPTEVDSEVIRDNRRFVPSHARAIEDYLASNNTWVMGPVTLSIDPAYLEFVPYTDGAGKQVNIGQLTIIQGGQSEWRILDGQHRRKAIRQFRRGAPMDSNHRVRMANLESCHMPIALYEEADTARIRQMFADMAKQKPMDAVTKARFDMRDPFNRAVEGLMEQSDWIGPYVEMDRSVVAGTSDKLVAFNQLSVHLKTLMFGCFGRLSKNRRLELEDEVESIVELGLGFTEDFLPSARKEYARLMDQDVEADFLPTQRKRGWAYNSTFLRILAGVYHDWCELKTIDELDRLAGFVRTVDLSRRSPSPLLVKSGVLTPGGSSMVPRRQELIAAIANLVGAAVKFDHRDSEYRARWSDGDRETNQEGAEMPAAGARNIRETRIRDVQKTADGAQGSRPYTAATNGVIGAIQCSHKARPGTLNKTTRCFHCNQSIRYADCIECGEEGEYEGIGASAVLHESVCTRAPKDPFAK